MQDYIEYMVDMREYDVPYHVRFAIDNGEWRQLMPVMFVIEFLLKFRHAYACSLESQAS